MSAASLALLLGLFSALTLAANNLAIKASGDVLTSRAVNSVSAAVLLLPLIPFVGLPDAATWGALAYAIPVHFLYQMVLVNALKRGDLSLVFPVMRGTAPLLTGVTGFLFLGEALTPVGAGSLLLATAAVLAFVWPPGGLGQVHPNRTALIFAGLTAVGVALYNVADANGVRVAETALLYIVWVFVLDSVGITAVAVWRRGDALAAAVRRTWRHGLAGGLLAILSYGAALYAFTLVEAVKVSAVRETAVVFGALMGAVLLKEGFGVRRVLAALALAAGLAILQFGG